MKKKTIALKIPPIDYAKLPSPMHLSACQKFRSTIVESRKRKPPKYKHKVFEYD